MALLSINFILGLHHGPILSICYLLSNVRDSIHASLRVTANFPFPPSPFRLLQSTIKNSAELNSAWHKLTSARSAGGVGSSSVCCVH